MISSPNRSRRSGAPVRIVAVHTAEGALNVTSLGNYFARASVQASSHAGIDDHSIETYVPYSEAAWTMRSANNIADQVELCGFAAWTRTQWLNEHRPMLELCARWIRERCQARGIPIRKLTPAQVGAGMAGVCGHIDWTLGMRDGTHTDPGSGFPWDFVMDLAAGAATPSPTPRPVEDDLPTPADLWQHAIPDEYTPQQGDSLPAFAALGFTLARVTWALEQIQAVAGVVQRLEAKVDHLQAGTPAVSQTGTSDLSDAQLARIAKACADEQARRLTA